MRPLSSDDMLLFAKVVESNSLSAAGRLTDRPKASISRAVARLEDALNVRLLERSARRTVVTEAGRVFYAYCLRVGETIEEAEGAIGELQGTVQGKLRIGCSVTIGQTLLAALVPAFSALHPQLTIELEITNRSIAVVEEGFDVVLKPGPLADSSLVAKDLGILSYGIFASPAYVDSHEPVVHPADLARAPVVDNFGGQPTSHWEFRRSDEPALVQVRPLLDFNDAFMRRQAVIQGAGIGLIPNWICREALAAGQLVRVLPEWTSTRFVRVYAVWPSRLHPTPRLRAFVDFMAEHMPKLLSD